MLVLLTLALYSRVRDFQFVNFDDPDYVTQNSYVQSGLTADGLSWAFWNLHGEATYWHPLTWVSHMIDCQLFGLDSGAHHLINVMFHALNVFLLFYVLYRMTGAVWRSAVVAALFAYHPLQVDSVAWISERKNVLSGFFWFLTMLAYLRYTEISTRARYVVLLLCFALGLMAKPVLVTLPGVLFLLDFWPLRRVESKPCRENTRINVNLRRVTLKRSILEKLPLLGLSFLSSVLTLAGHAKLGTTLSTEEFPMAARLGNAFVSYARYLLKTFWPTRLSVYYPLENWTGWQIGLAIVLVIALTMAVIIWRHDLPWMAVGWFWFLGVLVPTIGLVQASTQAMADRFAYLSLVGVFIGVVWFVGGWIEQQKRRRAISVGVSALVLFPLCAMTWAQLGVWRNSITLFTHALNASKESAVAHNNLGTALEEQKRFAEAEKHYRAAIRLKPRSPQAYNNLGNVLDETGRREEALTAFRRALELRPGVALVHNNLGVVLAKLGRLDEAQTNLSRAMELQPRDPHAFYLTGTLYLRRGDLKEATNSFGLALRLNPNHVRTLLLFARLLAANENAPLRNGSNAILFAERGLMVADAVRPATLDTLAMAYAEAGRFDDAIKAAESAMELLKAGGDDSELLNEISQRRSLFTSRTPYRESVSNLVARKLDK